MLILVLHINCNNHKYMKLDLAKRILNRSFPLFCLLFFVIFSKAQGPCNLPGQTVQTSFPVCGATVFNQVIVPKCIGPKPPAPTCDKLNNCYFYKFTVSTAGSLGFLITPVNLSDDYDFYLYNVTNATNLNDIYTDATLFQVGNFSGAGGVTGCKAGGVFANDCSGSGSTFSALQNVQVGEKFILCVVNFIGTGSGYGLNFTGGTSTIDSNDPIDFDNAASSCSNNSVKIKLTKEIKCTSIAPNGSDFSISPAATIISATSTQCAAGQFTTDEVILTFAAPLAVNTYTLTTKNGIDGNTLLGVCNDPMPVGLTEDFIVVATQVPPKFDQVLPLVCSSSKIKVRYDKPILCSSIANDGSDFTITGPSGVTITGATAICTGTPATTNEVEIQLTAPITVGGTYTLKVKNGTDLNTVLDLCGFQQAVANSVSFITNSTVDANFTYTIKYGCVKDTVLFFNNGANATNWSWDFDDAASGVNNTSTLQNPVHIFSSFGTKNVKLTLNNAICTDTKTNVVNLDNEITIGFNILPKDSVCLLTPIQLNSSATGLNLTHQWNFGNGQTSVLTNPLPILYTSTGSYNINYKITNNYNCSLSLQKVVTTLPLPLATYTINKVKICENDAITFNGIVAGNVNNYIWNFGDTSIINGNLSIMHTYLNKGNYTTSLIVNDKYCGSDTFERNIIVVALPRPKLGPDVTLCNDEKVTLYGDSSVLYNYNWSTGETTPSIIYTGLTNTIILTETNDICVARDTINIKVLASCKVYMPTAFTPNGDNVNDLLSGLNTDLATEYKMEVFDRLGQRVFYTINPLQGWDGKYKGQLSPVGTYVWKLQFKEHNAKELLHLKGTCVLLR
jgi:gliding motility-associated-like protein